MKFFSGFCFENESELFGEYIDNGEFCVAGFSKGAIEAFEYSLTCKERIDKLQLFSPAFFQNQDEKFKRLQILSFKRDEKKYIENFLKSCTDSTKDMEKFFKKGTLEELEFLLRYKWSETSLSELKDRGVKIEVFLGSEDKIIKAKEASLFFTPFATVYLLKNRPHTL